MTKTPLGNSVWLLTVTPEYQPRKSFVFAEKPTKELLKDILGPSFPNRVLNPVLSYGESFTASGIIRLQKQNVIT